MHTHTHTERSSGANLKVVGSNSPHTCVYGMCLGFMNQVLLALRLNNSTQFNYTHKHTTHTYTPRERERERERDIHQCSNIHTSHEVQFKKLDLGEINIDNKITFAKKKHSTASFINATQKTPSRCLI